MPRRAVRQLQQLLSEKNNNQRAERTQSEQSSSLARRRGNDAVRGNGIIIRCYRCLRSRSTCFVVLLSFAAVLHKLYNTLVHGGYEIESSDIRVLPSNHDDEGDAFNVRDVGSGSTHHLRLQRTGKDDGEPGSKITVEPSNHELKIQQRALDHLRTLGDFPKIVHIIWSDKAVLSKQFEILEHGVKNLQRINPDWRFVVHDYADVDATFRNFRHPSILLSMLAQLKNAHIVEKTDAFRLLKIFEQGGLYVDIDRVMNVNLNEVIDTKSTKMVLATFYDENFTNDLFGSPPGNILLLDAFKRQCVKRKGYARKNGWIKSSDQMELVRTYTSSIETDLFGREIGSGNEKLWDEARHVLTSHSGGMIVTYKDVWCDGLLVNDFEGCKSISRDSLYAAYSVGQWAEEVDKAWQEDEPSPVQHETS